MPKIPRRQVYDTIKQSLEPTMLLKADSIFKQALEEAKVKDKPFFTPEETASLAHAVMKRAVAEAPTAMLDALIEAGTGGLGP